MVKTVIIDTVYSSTVNSSYISSNTYSGKIESNSLNHKCSYWINNQGEPRLLSVEKEIEKTVWMNNNQTYLLWAASMIPIKM